MDHFLLGFHVIFPIFFVLMMGFFFRQIHIIDSHFISQATNLIFYVTLPIKLVIDVSTAQIRNFNVTYVIYLLLGVLFMFFASWLVGKSFIRDKRKLSTFVHCAYRSNFLYIGLPILEAVMPDYDMEPVLIAMIFGITLFNILGIFILTYYSEHHLSFSEMMLKIVKNPLIIGIAIGVVFKLVGVQLPSAVLDGGQLLTRINTPLSLVMIGGSLTFTRHSTDKLAVGVSAVFKNVVGAAVLTPIAVMLGFSHSEIVVAYLLYTTPCAINCFVMGKKLGADELMTSQIITLSYVISLVTFALGIAILSNFGIVH
ncbi:AEC family transporter [Peptoniphilus equinus]|uniref:AEC family transporter n=1 Tax=Peptoniphilus equinus TaxID=3016343 RepID=A0ABY7QUM4_9FIRM|nr:AEC family transporter [Peptoniphilus equinus]WBW50141.1 AEC family transporter [Peptoniphilus equinus]